MKNIEIEGKIKEMVDKLDKSDDIIYLAYKLEKLIKYAGDRYINLNLNGESDDLFIDKCFLAEEFEEKLRSEMSYGFGDTCF
ncbi:MAG: hypothetical protein RSC24_06795 [Clostridium sp.]